MEPLLIAALGMASETASYGPIEKYQRHMRNADGSVGDDTVPGFLDFTPKSGQPMRVQLASSISGPLLAIDTWELLVDPESSYSARSSDPHPRDAIISSGQFGFAAVHDYSEIYIGLTGLALPEPDRIGDFCGFRKW